MRSIISGITLLLSVELIGKSNAKVAYGFAKGSEVAFLTEFCYVIPVGTSGSIASVTALSDTDSSFLIFNKSRAELKHLLTEPCTSIAQDARVVEKFLPTYGADKLYRQDFNLTVNSNMSFKDTTILATHCNGTLSMGYRIEMINPGGLFTKHFSCYDQGVLQLYFCIIPFAIVAAVYVSSHWHSPSRSGNSDSPQQLLALIGLAFLAASVSLAFFHLLIFSHDGIGIFPFRVGAVFADLMFTLVTVASALRLLAIDRKPTRQPKLNPLSLGAVPRTVNIELEPIAPPSTDKLDYDVEGGVGNGDGESSVSRNATNTNNKTAICDPASTSEKSGNLVPSRANGTDDAVAIATLSRYGTLQTGWVVLAVSGAISFIAQTSTENGLLLHGSLAESLRSWPYLATRLYMGVHLGRACRVVAAGHATNIEKRNLISKVSFVQSTWLIAGAILQILPLSGIFRELLITILNFGAMTPWVLSNPMTSPWSVLERPTKVARQLIHVYGSGDPSGYSSRRLERIRRTIGQFPSRG